jgi:ribosome-binding factor A
MTRHYSKPPSNRQLKISHEIRSAMAHFFTKGEYYHPLLESVMVTIAEVRISADLKIATAFVILPDDTNKKEIMSTLKEVIPEIRKVITEKLQLRFSPEIRFVLDETVEKAIKIDSIFDSLHKKN